MTMRWLSLAASAESKRHSSTLVACSLNRAKLTPAPSQIAPSGYDRPGQMRMDCSPGEVLAAGIRLAHCTGPKKANAMPHSGKGVASAVGCVLSCGRARVRHASCGTHPQGLEGLLTRCAMRLRTLYCVIKQAAAGWVEDNAPTQGAALAYYAVFSLAPVLLIAISMAGLIVGEDAARSGIATEVRETLGPATADAVAALLNHTYETGDNIVATVLGLVTLLLGASGVYVQLQAALNSVWKTEAPRARG